MKITAVRGDITEQHVDAVVNAANSSLLGGGGVDGAIHRRGGKAILDECRALRDSRYGRGLPIGQAVATTAGELPARWVIHTVGPGYGADDRAELLASCYRESLRVADELGATSVAFPAVSAGSFGWPAGEAARVAVETVWAADTKVAEARFVLFDETVHQAFQEAVRKAGPTDAAITADLAALPDAHWQRLFARMDGLTDADREVKWGGGKEVSPGVTQLPYPIYSDAIQDIRHMLPIAVFDWPKWMRDNPVFPEGAGLDERPVADAVRLATAYLRGERFSDGAIEQAIENGALRAIVDRLRKWTEQEKLG
ncbi:O-acetyl-ADP-ribose deacetylase [Actinokineospora xionganensis]|uniref:O-acetyl-ADP-ribose deacetylase n=1 Tax=Actinokineospora xionganensis TaxID=2684470 RepID=A0ABR7L8Q3_9PSEU|nr:O-acetyl-ADP-ribose deacetylase [Actinokineospora xionganensis]